MDSERIGSGRHQCDRQYTEEQARVDDAGPLLYGFGDAFGDALVTTPKNGMTHGVLIL
jgi:hypothetical protein